MLTRAFFRKILETSDRLLVTVFSADVLAPLTMPLGMAGVERSCGTVLEFPEAGSAVQPRAFLLF